MKKILVLGSLSTDFVAITDRRPNVGETIQARDFFTTFGGKGANQAVAASRLGSEVIMLGKVGDDLFGERILKNLEDNSVDTNYVESVSGISSGAALITITDSDNSIVYVPGANGEIDREFVRRNKENIIKCDMAIAQNEVSEEAIEALSEICFNFNIPFILNPAPYKNLKKSILEKACYILPNESECKLLYPELSVEDAVKKYPNKLIVTMGEKGTIFNDGNENHTLQAFKVETVDTTGAGDTFIGGFSTGILNGFSIKESIVLGNLAASESITKIGAQSGMPTLESLKKNRKYNEKWNL